MRHQKFICSRAWGGAKRSRLVGCALILGGLTGCGSGIGDPSVIDGNRSTLVDAVGKTNGEPNDAFSQAIVAVFDGQGVARLQGTVARAASSTGAGDLDVFDLGSLSPGDKMIVEAETTYSALDVSIAVFDAAGRLVAANDDREFRVLDSRIEWIVRHSGEHYHLVVTHSAFAGSGQFTGTYGVDVTVIPGFEVPPPAQQTLVLDFDGGELNWPDLGLQVIAPFDAGAISPIYAGQTETLKELIRDVVEQNFASFGVTVLTSDDPPPVDGTCSTILIGGVDSLDMSVFGIAESVDMYNADFCDDAIIYSESFYPEVFSVDPSVEGLAAAIGNVTAHEAGHILGLNHVDDDWALMDDRSAADAFLEDQEFIEAPLSRDVMPIGSQDAALLLEETVGASIPQSFASTRSRWASSQQTLRGAGQRAVRFGGKEIIRRRMNQGKRSH